MSAIDLVALDAATPAAHGEWVRRWTEWTEREPMAHPDYVRLFAAPGDRAVCLAYGDATSGILFPLILRPLAREPWATRFDGRWDATTPYGYGGPFGWGAAVEDGVVFGDAVRAWCAVQGVVSIFARLSLFSSQLLPFPGETSVNMPNVVRKLDSSVEDIWKDYAHKVRKNVNAARRANLTVEIDERGSRLEEFLAIYASTMDRRNAADGYYFSREFFEAIVRLMPGSAFFAHVLSAGKVVSTELVLRSTRHLYSFLGGTLAEAFELRPNDLLKHAIIEWGQAHGLSDFVLGGGYGGPDGIFKYKLAFAPHGEVPFQVGRWVLDPAVYGALMDARRAWDATRGAAWVARPGFFPEYRG